MKPHAILLALALIVGCSATPASSGPKATDPIARTDRGWDSVATGCGDFTVVVAHASKRRLLVFHGHRESLGLTKVGDRKTIDLSQPAGELDLELALYDGPGAGGHYCNDVPTPTPKMTGTFTAASGTVTVELTAMKSKRDFTLTITVSGVTIRKGSDLEAVPDATYAGVLLGWIPG